MPHTYYILLHLKHGIKCHNEAYWCENLMMNFFMIWYIWMFIISWITININSKTIPIMEILFGWWQHISIIGLMYGPNLFLWFLFLLRFIAFAAMIWSCYILKIDSFCIIFTHHPNYTAHLFHSGYSNRKNNIQI